MKSVLIVLLFSFLRLGIPALTLLIAGEIVTHRYVAVRNSRGGR